MSNKHYKNENSEHTDEISVERVVGVVSDCLRLNIRKEPKMDAPIVCVVNVLSELSIDPNNSTDEWFNVYTESGNTGFCLKKFVAVRR